MTDTDAMFIQLLLLKHIQAVSSMIFYASTTKDEERLSKMLEGIERSAQIEFESLWNRYYQ